jgi:hypothetical protein
MAAGLQDMAALKDLAVVLQNMAAGLQVMTAG